MSIRAELEKVSVHFGSSRILHDISLTLEPGEFVTMLGPSGSGKTTTLNVIAGFVANDSGQVRFDSEPVDKLPPSKRDLGIVFQGYALFPHMTVGENVAFPLAARKVPTDQRRSLVNEALRLVELDGMYDRKPSSLSGGQQQRVALARALVFRPRMLLLDEPLAALDKRLREAMQVELKRIQREVGVTTLAVTHDQTEALTMSDRVAIMHEGQLEQLDSPYELYWKPRTPFVARFLGEANLVDTTADGEIPWLDLRLGRRGTAVLRPESIGLAECGAAGEVRGSAVIEEINFQGSRYRVSCRSTVAADERLVVSVGPHASPEVLRVGARISLVVDPTAVHVVSDRGPDDSTASDEDDQDSGSGRHALSRTA